MYRITVTYWCCMHASDVFLSHLGLVYVLVMYRSTVTSWYCVGGSDVLRYCHTMVACAFRWRIVAQAYLGVLHVLVVYHITDTS